MSSSRDDEATILVLHGSDWQDVDIPLQVMDPNDNSSVYAFSQPVSPSEATLDGTQVQDAAVNHGAHEPKIGVPQADNEANGTQATNKTDGISKSTHTTLSLKVCTRKLTTLCRTPQAQAQHSVARPSHYCRLQRKEVCMG